MSGGECLFCCADGCGGVKVLAEAFDAIRHICDGKGRLNSLVTCTVVVEVDKSSCLVTEIVIGSKLGRGVESWLERDG